MNTPTTPQPGITRVSFADDPQPEGLPLVLVESSTKMRATLAAMEAIATPATIERRDILLGRAKDVQIVASDEDAANATDIASMLKGLRNDVEDARKHLKDPVLAIGRAIDSAALAVVQFATEELVRLERCVGNFAFAKEQQRQAEIRQREAEARRQREDAQRAADDARRAEEEARAKAARLAASAVVPMLGGEGVGLSTDMDALDAEIEADAATVRAQEAQSLAAAPVYAAPVAPAAKVAGASATKDWDFEVTDIAELYKFHPECVELKPRNAVIKAIIKAAHQQAGHNQFAIKGLRISPKINVATRAR